MIQSSKSLTIEQFVPSEKYKTNYDRIFGKKPTILSWKEEAETIEPTESQELQNDPASR